MNGSSRLDASTELWKGLLIKVLITFPTIQMLRFFTCLHKVWATLMSLNINGLENQITIPDTYLPPALIQGSRGGIMPAGKSCRPFFPLRRQCASERGTWPFLLLLLTLFLMLHPFCVSAEDMSADELTSRIQRAYDGMTDLKADFIQEIAIKSMKKTDREAGVLWIKNPGKMYWDYTKPKVKKLVINKKKTWLYVDEDKAVYIQKTDAAHRSKLAVKFLSGMGKLSDDFSVEYASKERVDPQGNYLLKLTARDQGSIPDKMEMTIDKKTFHVLACRFNDDYGNATLLAFSNIKVNTGVADSFFTFHPAPDVEIMNMP